MYQIPELKNISGLFHAFSTAEEGNMSFRYGEREKVVGNRENFLKRVEIAPHTCISFSVPDEGILMTVGGSDAGRGMDGSEGALQADGLFTESAGLYLFLFVADCIPIIFYDRTKEVVGLVHAGRKSAGMKLPTRSVEYMREQFNSNPSDIICALGPAISRDSYIKRDIPEIADTSWKPFLHRDEEGLWAVDLKGYVAAQLKDAGLVGSNIIISPVDTATDDRFFSHTRSARLSLDEARFACVTGRI